MPVKNFKEQVHEALEKAVQHHSVRHIARNLDINEQNIHGFRRRKVLGVDNIHALSAWLTAHGYLKDATPEPDKPPDIVEAMAADVEALSKLLRSEIDNATKARMFAERVTFWYQSMQEYLKNIKKG